MKNKKIISLLTVVALTAGVIMFPNFKTVDANNNINIDGKISRDTMDKTNIKKQIEAAVIEQNVSSEESDKSIELVVVSNGKDITKALKKLGATVIQKSTSVFLVNIPANKAVEVASIESVLAAGKDRILQLPQPVDLGKIAKANNDANPMLEYSNQDTSMPKFWNMGYDGKGTKVAIIDTGVEPKNEMLTMTSDGKIKIVDYQDFWHYSGESSEGDVSLTENEVQKTEEDKKFVEYEEKKIYVPDEAEDKVLLGFFKEGNLIYQNSFHDVNNNGKKDLIPVIVLNSDDNITSNDVILVDTNLNNDLTDEKAMAVYKDTVKEFSDEVIFELDSNNKPVIKNEAPVIKEKYKEAFSKLINNFTNLGIGYNAMDAEYNFVITRFDNNKGNWKVNLGYDGNGHGTHVAGDASGNGYTILPFVDTSLVDKDGNLVSDGTLKGAAPGAQIIACRVFQSDGGTPESSYMAAMEYSCENGADVINMSLGSLPDINDGTTPSSIFANSLSEKYGVVFCISAGNEGPSTNSVGTPGAGEWAITVGAYNPSWINYGYRGVEDGLWYFSSRGPTEDGRLKPTILAPGSMVSSMPMWSKSEIRTNEQGGGTYVGYGRLEGTSMASPYAAGTVAALVQAMKENNLPYHPLVIKDAIFQTGDKTLNNEVYLPSEIGGGMLEPCKALEYLTSLKEKGLVEKDLKTSDGYIGKKSIEVYTEFDYSEKLSYKPEGLYVRSGDIPEQVNVTLTNMKDVDLNLNLIKDSYSYDNSWMGLSESQISLAKGESKTITLTIDRSKLNPGVNSLLIRMEDEATVLSEGYIPVTVVNYMDLCDENISVSEEQEREFKPGEVSKHFIRIPYGTKKVEIDLEMTDRNDTSNLLPLVSEPSGIQLSNVPGAEWLDSYNNKKTLILNNPTPGTWEIDLFSGIVDKEYIPQAIGKHKITARIKGVAFNPDIIEYSGKSGEYIDNDVALQILNATGSENQKVILSNTRLVETEANKITNRMEIENGQFNTIKFNIPENDPNLFVKIQTTNPKNQTDDLDLYLVKVIKNSQGNEVYSQPIALSANVSSIEEIYLEGLQYGEYAILVEAFNTEKTTNYDLIYQVVNDSNGENAIQINEKEINFDGISKEVKIGLRVPVKPGKYFGYISARDLDGNLLGSARVKATAEATDNSISLKYDGVVRKGNGFDISLDGDIKDLSKLNNIYGVQFEIEYDENYLNSSEILRGDLFNDDNSKEIFKQVENGKIIYAVGFLNTTGAKDAVGAIEGNIAKIKAVAKEAGSVSIKFNKLLAVNFTGDEISLNTILDYDLIIADPDIAGNDKKVDIKDITKVASRVITNSEEEGFDNKLDLNCDGVIDFKDLLFVIESFKEDN